MPLVFRNSGTYYQRASYSFLFPPSPSPVTINSVTAGSTGTGLIAGVVASDVSNGTAVTNGITYNVYSFQPGTGRLPAASSSSQATYTINCSCPNATTIYVLAVGGGGAGGGNGSSAGGGGGGAGGVVMTPVSLPAGTNQTISIAVGAGGAGVLMSSSINGTNGYLTSVTFSGSASPSVIYAGGGGGGTSSGSAGNAGSIYGGSGGGGNSTNVTLCSNNYNNYANNGGNNPSYNPGCGGGAGTAASTVLVTTAPGSRPGNGIQCFLPGISSFAPAGVAYGTYYWGGGGGCNLASAITGFTGNNIVGGGLGGGGGGVAGSSYYTFGDTAGINPAGNGASSGNGGNGGPNTGGGGGSSNSSSASFSSGSGGSGIVVIAFPSSAAVSSNQSAVLPSSIVSSNLYNAVLNNATLTTPAYSSIKAAFACRLVNYNYFGPIITLRHSLDTAGSSTQNFYTDICGNMGTGYFGTGQSVSNWLQSNGANTTYAFVTKWYNQGMDVSFNCATQYKITAQPIYDVSYGVINFGYTGAAGGVAAVYPAFMNLPVKSMPFGQDDSSFSVVTRYWNWANTYNDTMQDLISCYTSNNLGHIVFNYNGYGAIAVQNLNYTAGPTLATSNGVISYKYISRSTTTTNQSYVYQNNVAGTAFNSTAAVTFTPGPLTIGNYTSDINANGYLNTGTFSGTNYFLQAQLYNLYVFSSALTDADRNLVEATPYQFAPLPLMAITVSSFTSTTFVLSWTAVANATTYVMYINSVVYGTVTSGQTITPGYNGPWTVNVYAYNASYNVLASGYTVFTILKKATMNLQNWYLPDNVTITSGYVTAWPDEMGNYNLSNLRLTNTTNTMTKVVASGTTSNAIYQNFASNGTNACYVYGGSFSETIYVVLFAAYTTLTNGDFDEIFGDTTNSYSIRFTTGVHSLNGNDLNYGGTNYVNGTQITPGTNTFGELNTWNIYCMYITGSLRTAITNLAILGDYASNNRSFRGYAGDFFIGNASFGTTQQQQIEGYLGYKYKCQSSLPTSHPFYSSTNSKIVSLS